MINLNLNTIIQRKAEDYLFTEVDGDTVLMNVKSGAYFGMNKVATEIWKIIETPNSIQDISAQLVSKYDVSEEQCISETIALLKNLQRIQILEVLPIS